eukprot:Sdes_comp22788_c0_seq1m21186
MKQVLATARFNIVLMGIVFLFVFTAFSTIQVYAGKMYDPTTSSNMLTTLYAVFAVFSFFSPSVANKLGCRVTMMIGTFGYGALVAVGLVFFETGFSNGLVIFGGALCGIGAALLWTGQGRLILQYSTNENRGTNFAIFWSLFQAAAVVGGILTWTYFATMGNQEGSTTLYIIFLCVVLAGSFCLLFLKSPQQLQAKDIDIEAIRRLESEFSRFSWMDEIKSTLAMFSRKEMLLLAPLFWYTGFNQPYQLNVFVRFFTNTSLGMGMVIFYAAEILGAIFIGYLLDNLNPSRRRHLLVWGQYLLGVLSFALAIHEEWDYVWYKDAPSYDIGDRNLILPSIIFFMWGLSDSMIQTYCYWLMGNLYSKGENQARAVGFYKFVQSVGWSIGFSITPFSRCPAMGQILVVFVMFLVGLPLGWLIAPRDEQKPFFAVTIKEDDLVSIENSDMNGIAELKEINLAPESQKKN